MGRRRDRNRNRKKPGNPLPPPSNGAPQGAPTSPPDLTATVPPKPSVPSVPHPTNAGEPRVQRSFGQWLVSFFWLRKRRSKILLVVFLILLPMLCYLLIAWQRRFPEQSIIAQSRPGGRHHQITTEIVRRLGMQLKQRDDPVSHSLFPTKVTGLDTRGSLDNFHRLQNQEVDFAVYQAGTSTTLHRFDFAGLDGWIRKEDRDKFLTPDEFFGQRPESLRKDPKHRDEERKRSDRAFKLRDTSPPDGRLSYDEFTSGSNIRFVANLYYEVLHVIVRKSSKVRSIEELRQRKELRTFFGWDFSGHDAMSKMLLEHLNLKREAFTVHPLSANHLKPSEICELFEREPIDAAFLTFGLHTEAMNKLLNSGMYELLSVPSTEAFARKVLPVQKYVIPQGYFRAGVNPIPAQDVQTVAVRAQLLTHKDVDPRLVEQVTRIVLSTEFHRSMNLGELFDLSSPERLGFVSANPAFSTHEGAKRIYNPEGFDVGVFEGWEALMSLSASIVIGLIVAVRWIGEQREKARGHRLDEFIRKLFDLERGQMEIDVPTSSAEISRLQRVQDRIALLRQEALVSFSAHEIEKDRVLFCFFEMCYYVSAKVGEKISQQQLKEVSDTLSTISPPAESQS